MNLKDFLVMTGLINSPWDILKILYVIPPPFKNSEKSVKNQALIYVSTLKLNAFRFLERGTVCNISYNRIVINHV